MKRVARNALDRCLPILLSIGIGVQVATVNASTHEQLARMATALRSLSYEGVLVYAYEGHLETLRIIHRVEGGHVSELLESLNGPVRTLTRERDKVTCRLAGDRAFSVPGRGLGADLLVSKPIDPQALSLHYVIRPLGGARVAGRETEVVGIIPRDALRYGYRFYIDIENGLPLKSDLMGTEQRPIEQILFVSLELDPAPPDHPMPAAGSESSSMSSPEQASAPLEPGPWRFERLPAGFRLVMADRSADEAEQVMDHFVLSDGLASVSVYIETGDEDGLSGGSRIGAVHAAGGKIAGHQVTVVGEVPEGTVQAVLDGIAFAGEGGG